MVGILYCQKSTFAYKELETFLCANGIAASCIAAEEITAASLEPFSVILNAMDSFFPEEKVALLADFFHAGKNILHLGNTPFTVNYDNGKVNNRVLRSFGIVDDLRPIQEESRWVKTADGETHTARLTGLYGAVYHLCERTPDGQTVRCAHLEPLLTAFDDKNELIATPVMRVVTHQKGSMTFFGFAFDLAMLKEDFWKDFFLTLIQRELTGNILLSVDSSFSRYYPDESKPISLRLENINLKTETDLTLTISIHDNNDTLVFTQSLPVSLPYEITVTPKIRSSSLYRITASVTTNNCIISSKKTGFLVLSDEEMEKELHQFHPMYTDESIANDFCLVDGKITAITGTTYFVTDVYRECFYSMNAWLCSQEMAQLKKDGFNVLRSGNWHYTAAFYQADGSISERGKRALQTYFLLAARNGFTVQFALGNVMLNQWDKTKSPIHNSEMRQKCMTFVCSFAKAFRGFPNVTLDIVNEPSYSDQRAWTTARPSYEAGELIRYREWLSDKYHGKIEDLRNAWGESAAAIRTFDDIEIPDSSLFSRKFQRIEHRINFPSLTDFYGFARSEFLTWTAEVRSNIKSFAPDMPVIMGRDETLRVPAQQDELLAGNIDMVCWHQWHYNSTILTEYLLNRVRGKLCVAQELGMYKYDDIRSGKRHTDHEMAAKLEKKLLYAFGNFVQWQAHDDPFMFELSENALGLYRADMSPTPSLRMTRNLIAAEKSMQSYQRNRQDDKIKIMTVYGTSHHFSVDHTIALQGIKNHIYALFHCLKEQSDFMLEHLFTKENASVIGEPKLIILPAMQLLLKDTWETLMTYVKNGAVLLINGCIDKDEYFADDAKIGTLDSGYTTEKLMNFEEITIDKNEYLLDFRQAVGYTDVSNVLNCGRIPEGKKLVEYPVGKGTILYCPYPLELSSNYEAICACYQYAIEKAQAQNTVYKVVNGKPHILLMAASYEDCTVYTLINEGFTDTITWIDLRSQVKFSAVLEADRSCKVWISGNGQILQIYGEVTCVC